MYEKIILVTRKTRLEGLLERFNTKSQAKFYLQQNDQQQLFSKKKSPTPVTKQTKVAQIDSFGMYEAEHNIYYAAVAALKQSLQKILKLQQIERSFLPNFLFSETDIVVTIGIDGLVVNTAKYLSGQPLIAVNPDPVHIDGILLPFNVSQAAVAINQLLHNQAQIKPISMAEASLNDGQTLLAFNDLFIGTKTHASARYELELNGQKEKHSSSGLIISTGAGSTGWLSSMFNMAWGIVNHLEPDGTPNQTRPTIQWDSSQLFFVVREPFVSKTSAASIVCGPIHENSPLIIESHMPSDGIIFSDGIQSDFLSFNAGSIATISLAKKRTNLVIES